MQGAPWGQYAARAAAAFTSGQGAPAIGRTAVGLGTVGLTNYATSLAGPSSAAVQGGGGPEVFWLAMLLNGVGQGLKQIRYFDEHKWLVPCMFVLAGGLAYLLWQDHIRALADATISTSQAVINFWGQNVSATPNVLPPTAPEKKFPGYAKIVELPAKMIAAAPWRKDAAA